MELESMSTEELSDLREKIEVILMKRYLDKSKEDVKKYKDEIIAGKWHFYLEDRYDASEYGGEVPEDEKEECVSFRHGKTQKGYADYHWTDEEREMMDEILNAGPFDGYEIVECTFPLKGSKEEARQFLLNLGFKEGIIFYKES